MSHSLFDKCTRSFSIRHNLNESFFSLNVCGLSPQNKYETNWVWHRKLAVHYCLNLEFKLPLFVVAIIVVVVVFILLCFIVSIEIYQSANAAKVQQPLIFIWTSSCSRKVYASVSGSIITTKKRKHAHKREALNSNTNPSTCKITLISTQTPFSNVRIVIWCDDNFMEKLLSPHVWPDAAALLSALFGDLFYLQLKCRLLMYWIQLCHLHLQHFHSLLLISIGVVLLRPRRVISNTAIQFLWL